MFGKIDVVLEVLRGAGLSPRNSPQASPSIDERSPRMCHGDLERTEQSPARPRLPAVPYGGAAFRFWTPLLGSSVPDSSLGASGPEPHPIFIGVFCGPAVDDRDWKMAGTREWPTRGSVSALGWPAPGHRLIQVAPSLTKLSRWALQPELAEDLSRMPALTTSAEARWAFDPLLICWREE